MTFRSERRRRSTRLKGYDYSSAGAYFVTICAEGRECLFGEIVGDEMHLNDAGRAIEQWWLELDGKYPAVETDEYAVMPNHFHGIIVITPAARDVATAREPGQPHNPGQPHRVAPTACGDVGAALGGRPTPATNPDPDQPREPGQPHRVAPTVDDGAAPTLGDIVGWFKTMTTNEYIRGVKTLGWPPFNRRVWQRNYYEHIIRSETELDRIRDYVVTNPLRWALDRENPQTAKPARPEASWQR